MGLSLDEYRNLIDLTPFPRPALLHTEEEKSEACEKLLKFLLRERGLIAAFSATYERKRQLVRNYMNERAAIPVPSDILQTQDALFWTESVERGIVDVESLPETGERIVLWEGNITRLNADAIVNAANKSLLGCFLPGHNCIDNVIHSYAGMQMRSDCARIMANQGSEECGEAKMTRAYNLPSKYVLHTVGPMVGREVTVEQRAQLRSCYTSCLNLAKEAGLSSVAFCCVATGVFNFPREEAAEIAVGSLMNWRLRNPDSKLKVVFNTFLAEDTEIYKNILGLID